ncbi:amidohydrolase family protein [Actinacidiphila soli]|uniref:amidohydrolase family protein n=1 Tax=Actinacidiphila soli TaxID=2487275 RepID=UPI000FCC0F38|nr:amidohydrolase family protein [Actinacidiphila soli]
MAVGGSNPLVDVHVHLYPNVDAGRQAKDSYVIWEYGDDPGVEFAAAAGDLADLAATYGQAGFDRAVVVHLFDTALARTVAMARPAPGRRSPEEPADITEAVAAAMRASNRWAAETARNNPLVEVLVSLDPTVLTRREIVDHLTELADAGVRGVKLHPVAQGLLPNDPRLHAIYDICSDAALVVLSHSGPGHRGDASARPSEFGPVLGRWPNLRLILAHLGGASWRETAELADTYPQVAFDLSEIIEWTGAPNAPSTTELAELVRHIGADRVMLGSDFPWYDPVRTADRVDGLPGLGAGERAAILGGTAVRLLDLER